MTENKLQSAELKKLIDRYNYIIVVLFCGTNLSPILIFYMYGKGEWKWFIITLATSLLINLLPNAIIDRIQFSQSVSFYRNLGVHVFKRFATSGDIINRQIRRKFPHHRNVHDLKSAELKLEETYSAEKLHWIVFIFTIATIIHIFSSKESLGIGILLIFSNIAFNFYPSLLQQYNRLRLKRALKMTT
jgi:hypothetical protein